MLYCLKPAAADMPRRSGYPQGSGEVLERDRGSQSPVSFQPPPRGANKIYTYDVVFSPGEARKNDISQTPIPYKITKNISQTQFDKQTASQKSLYRKYTEAARRGTGCHGILVPAALNTPTASQSTE